jgi:hypothetical protein
MAVMNRVGEIRREAAMCELWLKPMKTCLRSRLACLAWLLLAGSVLAESAGGGYRAVPDWPRLPPEHQLGLCAGVGVDASNRVFVFHRSGRQCKKGSGENGANLSPYLDGQTLDFTRNSRSITHLKLVPFGSGDNS